MKHFSGYCIFHFFLFLCLLFLLSSARLGAQESILSSYERNFIRASLPAKTSVLNDAATDEKSAEFIGALCEIALQFALANGESLRGDPDMIDLVAAAARGARTGGNTASVKSLWDLFQIYHDPYSRVEILGALAVLGKGNPRVIQDLNQFLEEQNNSFRSSGSTDPASQNGQDYPVLRACIEALGILGDDSSFPVLFSAMTTAYPQAVTGETLKALESLHGNYRDFLIAVIQKNPFPEKAAAFRIGAYNDKLQADERGELAQAALEAALEYSGPAGALLRYDAITVLTGLKWSSATPLAIRNFYQVQADYTSNIAPRERLIEAIVCLGAMGRSEAAQALALQLGYINSQTEKSGEYDEALVLALIDALGELADKSAFDYLLHISYLNYPDKIQAAAREALNRLTW